MAFTSVMTRLSEMAKSKRYLKRIYYYGKSYFLPTDFNHIEVEITSFCNRKCEYCPNVSFDKLNSSGSFLIKDKILNNIIDQLRDINYNGTLAPHMYGETLAHPEIVEITEKISKSGIKLDIFTNADYLNKDLLDKLRAAGLYKLSISKHSKNLSNSSLKALRDLFDNITAFKGLDINEILEKINCQDIKINGLIIKVVDFYKDFHTSKDMLHNRGGELDLELNKKARPIGCNYVLHPVIDVEGNIVLCCNDYKGKHIMGNVMERHLYDIWKDPNNVWLRNKIYRGSLDLKICQECVL